MFHSQLKKTITLFVFLFGTQLYAQEGSLVKWKSGEISVSEIKADLLKLPPVERDTTLRNAQAISQLLDNIQVYKELEARAKRENFVTPEVMLSAELARVRQVGTLYLSELAERETTRLGDLTSAAREQYTANRDKYRKPEQITSSHILVSTAELSDVEAKKKAQEIHGKALAGENFSDLAKRYSDDTGSKDKGGSLGPVGKGAMVKPFEDALWALEKPGAIAPVVKTQFGFHVIRLDGKTPASLPPFDDLKAEIIAQLKKDSLDNWRLRLLSDIRNDSSIKIDDVLFEKVTGATRKSAAPKPAAQ
jgi:peptidyl-prolyl cis-trans isomerase C